MAIKHLSKKYMKSLEASHLPTDEFGRNLRDIRISLTDQCNLRCGYCMPAEVFNSDYPFLSGQKLLTFHEIAQVVEVFVQCGGKKVRLTGGEPLLRKDVDQLIGILKGIQGVEEVALTTNGLLLPKYIDAMVDAGLDRVTLSLDALEDSLFQKMSGRAVSVRQVLVGIDAARDAGIPVKVNSVIIRGLNDHQVLPLAEFFKPRDEILRYIEFMDVGNCNGWAKDQVYSAKEILSDLTSQYDLEPVGANYVGEVAKRYRYLDGSGEIGIISSVSQPFCRSCNRARLSADGKLYTCLFASQGHDLRSVLRSGEDLKSVLENLWTRRKDRYSELRGGQEEKKIEMSYIGG